MVVKPLLLGLGSAKHIMHARQQVREDHLPAYTIFRNVEHTVTSFAVKELELMSEVKSYKLL